MNKGGYAVLTALLLLISFIYPLRFLEQVTFLYKSKFMKGWIQVIYPKEKPFYKAKCLSHGILKRTFLKLRAYDYILLMLKIHL